MARIKSFEDIEKIDSDLASLFLRSDEAVNWIYAVEHGVKDWIAKNNKQYWEIVRYVSEQRGILGTLKKDKKIWLKREDFARVLLMFCPHAFKEGETVGALKSSMEHYQFASVWKKLDNKSNGHIVRPLIKNVENLLDQAPIIESHKEESKPTLEDLVEEYLRVEIEEPNKDKFPRSIVCVRPQYEGVSPAISIETYHSEKLLKGHQPSHVEAYEFVDGVLQEDELYRLHGRYSGKYMKLFVVSSSGLLPQVRALAEEKNIGYVRLNPNSKMTSENYILRRSIEDDSNYWHDIRVLTGTKPMTTSLLIMDNSRISSSLTDVLSEYRVVVKERRLLNIPFLSNDEIEERADNVTGSDVTERLPMLKVISSLGKESLEQVDLSIDPFVLAESCGLSHSVKELESNGQLGRLDVEKSHAILNRAGLDNYNRFRFTMAHELGHHILHSHLFKEQSVVSVGESEETLSISLNDSRKLEHQANLFASFLLMPKTLVVTLYCYLYEINIHQVYGDSLRALYYNPDQRETWGPYNNVVGIMTNILGVSHQALQIRLKSLNLLKMPGQ